MMRPTELACQIPGIAARPADAGQAGRSTIRTVAAVVAGAVSLASTTMSGGCIREPGRTFGGTYDAGTFLSDTTPTITHRFVIHNDTSDTIKILSKLASCICTRSELEKSTIRPGEKTTLVMEVKTPRAVSAPKTIVTLRTDYTKKPEWNFVLSFRSYPRIVIEPKVITLTPTSPRVAFSVSQFESSRDPGHPRPELVTKSPHFLISLGDRPSIETLRGGVRKATFEGSLGVSDDAGRRFGRLEDAVTFRGPHGEAASLLAMWDKPPRVKVAPSVLHFGSLGPDESRKISVLVTSTSSAGFRLLGSTSESTAGHVVVDGNLGDASPAATAHRLSLTFASPRTYTEPTASGTVMLRTDEAEQPEVKLSWSAILRKSPELVRRRETGSDRPHPEEPER